MPAMHVFMLVLLAVFKLTILYEKQIIFKYFENIIISIFGVFYE